MILKYNYNNNNKMSNQTNNILKKWLDRGNYFIRHIDGNIQNNRVDNLMWVSVKDGLENFEEWKFDWGDTLTKTEKRIVNLKSWRDGLIFKQI
jgi:hypothetical protein